MTTQASLCARCHLLPRHGADHYCKGCRHRAKVKNQNLRSNKKSYTSYLAVLAAANRPKGTRR